MTGSVNDVKATIEQATDALTVRRVFGDPIEKDGVTVIPAARVHGGAGGGTGEAGGGEHDRDRGDRDEHEHADRDRARGAVDGAGDQAAVVGERSARVGVTRDA